MIDDYSRAGGIKMKKTIITTLLMLFLLVSICNAEHKYIDKTLGLTVYNSSQEEFASTQKAVKKAYKFFAKHGHTGVKPIVIRFQETVMFKFNETTSVKIYGHYDIAKKVILITKRSATWLNTGKIYGLKMTDELYRSIITHEIAHFLLNEYSGGITGQGIREYVAYIAQIQSLSKDTIDSILKNYPGEVVDAEWDINFLIYLFDPHKFGVKCYKYYCKTEGYFVEKAINEKFNPNMAFPTY